MRSNNSNPVKTTLIISVGFILVYLFSKGDWAIYTSLIIGFVGIFSTYLSKKIHFLWMKLAWLLSLIIPNIVLGIIFFLFLLPISILSKLFRKKDPLQLKNTTDSVFIDVNKNFEKSCFEKTW